MKKVFISFVISFSSIILASEHLITNPTYPGTNLKYNYVAWSCAVPGTCATPADFNPTRGSFYGAVDYLNENGVCRSLGYESAV